MSNSGEVTLSIKAGSTGQSVLIPGNVDPTAFRCQRVRQNPTLVLASGNKLAAMNSTYSSGKWYREQNYNVIRFDIPDAWLEPGSRQVGILATDTVPGTLGSIWIELTETDNQLGEITPTNLVTEFPSGTTTKVKTTVKDAAGAGVTDATVKMTTASGIEHTASHEGSGVYSSTFTDSEINDKPVQITASSQTKAVWAMDFLPDQRARLSAYCSFPSNGLSLPAGFPTQAVVQLVNQRKEPVTNATITCNPFGEGAFSLSHQGDGVYSASYTPGSGTHSGNIVFSIAAAGYPDATVYLPASVKIG